MRELALHILDVARNGIEADATRVEVAVWEDHDADTLKFAVRDNGSGMDAETIEKAMDPFYTTRSTRRLGLGLPLLRATCRRCGGDLEIISAPGEGTEVQGTLELSHLDRPPLGDMGAVVQSLACEAQRASFSYEHSVDGRQFSVDTSEVIEQVGKDSLTNPSVLHWLGKFVRDGVEAAGSHA